MTIQEVKFLRRVIDFLLGHRTIKLINRKRMLNIKQSIAFGKPMYSFTYDCSVADANTKMYRRVQDYIDHLIDDNEKKSVDQIVERLNDHLEKRQPIPDATGLMINNI